MTERTDSVATAPADVPALQVTDLLKHYADADRNVFDGISFSVPKGKVLVIVGPSGSGKSTLLRAIAGLEPIQGGTIALDGQVIETGKPGNEKSGRAKRPESLRTKFGMVFQSYELFPNKDVLGNITMAPMLVQKRKKAEVEREAMELLDRVHLADRAQAKPHELSGGQRQRVAICRALILHPEILLLDEITAALDPAGKVLGRPQFKIIQTKEAKITCTPSLGMQFDGEIISSNSGVFGARALPQCLDLIVDEFSPLGK